MFPFNANIQKTSSNLTPKDMAARQEREPIFKMLPRAKRDLWNNLCWLRLACPGRAIFQTQCFWSTTLWCWILDVCKNNWQWEEPFTRPGKLHPMTSTHIHDSSSNQFKGNILDALNIRNNRLVEQSRVHAECKEPWLFQAACLHRHHLMACTVCIVYAHVRSEPRMPWSVTVQYRQAPPDYLSFSVLWLKITF